MLLILLILRRWSNTVPTTFIDKGAHVKFANSKVRSVKRIMFRWYWKDDNDKWIPYNEQQSVTIERGLVNNHAEVEIDVEGFYES